MTLRARYNDSLKLERMWSPLAVHPSKPTPEQHYRRLLVRFERVAQERRREMNALGWKLAGYALMALRREAE